MKRNLKENCPADLPTTQTGNTSAALANSKVEEVKVFIRSISVIATSMAVQVTGNTWDAVVTSVDRGTFLIRRRKDYIAGQCPCLGYEVRHIAAGGSYDSPAQDRGRIQTPAEEPYVYGPSVVMAQAQTPQVTKTKVTSLPEAPGTSEILQV